VEQAELLDALSTSVHAGIEPGMYLAVERRAAVEGLGGAQYEETWS
jgi:hypothetical protein